MMMNNTLTQLRELKLVGMAVAPDFDSQSSKISDQLNGIKDLASSGEFSCNGTSLSVYASV